MSDDIVPTVKDIADYLDTDYTKKPPRFKPGDLVTCSWIRADRISWTMKATEREAIVVAMIEPKDDDALLFPRSYQYECLTSDNELIQFSQFQLEMIQALDDA